jgi:hypothetical protein
MNVKSALAILETTKTPEHEKAVAYLRGELENATKVLDGTPVSDYVRFTGASLEECERLYRFVQGYDASA